MKEHSRIKVIIVIGWEKGLHKRTLQNKSNHCHSVGKRTLQNKGILCHRVGERST